MARVPSTPQKRTRRSSPSRATTSAGTLAVAKQRHDRKRGTDVSERQYVGIDLHRRRSVIVRVSQSGEKLATYHLDNDPMLIAAAIKEAGENP